MTYNSNDLVIDAQTAAKTLHVAYRRAKFVLERWFSGINAEIPNNSTEVFPGITGAELTSLITRCSELVADYEAGGNAKLTTIIQLSDLKLPNID